MQPYFFKSAMSRSAATLPEASHSTPYDVETTTYLARVTTESSFTAPNSLLAKSVYRTRFCLRLLSATFAATLIGSLSLAVRSYNSTKAGFLLWNGRQIWPNNLDMESSHIFFALAGVFLATSSALLLGSFWPKVRHLTNLGNYLALAVSFVNFAVSLAGAIFFYTYKAGSDSWTFWGWTCSNSQITHPDVTFSLVCSEIRFAWGMSVAVIVCEVLGFACFGMAIYVLRQHKRLQRTGSFFEKS